MKILSMQIPGPLNEWGCCFEGIRYLQCGEMRAKCKTCYIDIIITFANSHWRNKLMNF